MYQVSKCAPQEALWNLDAAFTHSFRRCVLKKQGKWKGKLGYPQLKTKKKGLGSFRLTGRIVVLENAIVLPRLGRLRLKEREYLPTGSTVQVLSATVSEQAGHWYVSVQVEQEQVIPNPRHLKRRLKKLKRLQRVVSRRQRGWCETGCETRATCPQEAGTERQLGLSYLGKFLRTDQGEIPAERNRKSCPREALPSHVNDMA